MWASSCQYQFQSRCWVYREFSITYLGRMVLQYIVPNIEQKSIWLFLNINSRKDRQILLFYLTLAFFWSHWIKINNCGWLVSLLETLFHGQRDSITIENNGGKVKYCTLNGKYFSVVSGNIARDFLPWKDILRVLCCVH